MSEFTTAAPRPATSAPPEDAAPGGALRPRLLRIGSIALHVALFALGLATLAGGVAYAALPAFGYEGRAVVGGSMEPSIAQGSMVIVERVSDYEIAAGDVITFKPQDSPPTTHRVVSVREVDGALRFTTKGDANEFPDPLETELPNGASRVVMTIPWAGELTQFGRSGSGLLLMLVAPALGLASLFLGGPRRPRGAKPGS